MIAQKFLQNKGYLFLTKNFHTHFGEIDLIFQKDNSIIFVEVKTRTSAVFGHPEEAVNHSKLKHIQKSAEIFLVKNSQYQNYSPRIDVVAIDLTTQDVRHYEGVY